MSLNEILEQLNRWYSQEKLAGLKLPDRWFGRPFGDLHPMTRAEVWGDRLIVELSGQLLLVFTEPQEPKEGDEGLMIGFRHCVFDWQEFGNKTPHTEVFESGSVAFVSQGAAMR